MQGDELLDGDHHRGDRGLHVGRAAAVKLAVANAGYERVGMPLFERAGRHHVGMAGEDHQRLRRAAPGPQVGHVAGDDRLACETERRQQCGEARLAAIVVRGDRGQRNQFFGQGQGFAHGVHFRQVSA